MAQQTVTAELYHVDAFADAAFQGNPAAVCLLSKQYADLPDSTLLKVAAEMNLSETSFLYEADDKDFSSASCLRLRWFTPTREVPLCGHATLATAAVLFKEKGNSVSRLEFETQSGKVAVTRRTDGLLELDFPLYPNRDQDAEEFRDVIRLAVGDLPIVSCILSEHTKKLLLHVTASRTQLEQLEVDTSALMAAHGQDIIRGVIVTVDGNVTNDGGFDFLSRYFAPWNGIPEDPVTGSAHTVLAGYWSQRLGKTEMRARQCSPRGGNLAIDMCDADKGRVRIAGNAAVVVRGTISFAV